LSGFARRAANGGDDERDDAQRWRTACAGGGHGPPIPVDAAGFCRQVSGPIARALAIACRATVIIAARHPGRVHEFAATNR
jgi:hypothetical protein